MGWNENHWFQRMLSIFSKIGNNVVDIKVREKSANELKVGDLCCNLPLLSFLLPFLSTFFMFPLQMLSFHLHTHIHTYTHSLPLSITLSAPSLFLSLTQIHAHTKHRFHSHQDMYIIIHIYIIWWWTQNPSVFKEWSCFDLV